MEDAAVGHGIAPRMFAGDDDHSHSHTVVYLSDQQRAAVWLSSLVIMQGQGHPVDAEMLQWLQRRATEPPVIENTNLDILLAYTQQDGLSPQSDDDDDNIDAVDIGFDEDAYNNGGFGAVPALIEAIVSLPEMSVGEASEKECGVCLEEFEEGDKLRKMPCEHYFHEKCVFDWLQVSHLCPYCRFAIPAEFEEEEDEGEDEHDEGEEAMMCVRFLFPE